MELVRTTGELRGEEPHPRRLVRRLERNPRHIERTVGIQASEIDDWQAYLDAGAEHFIVMTGPPFDLDPVRKLLEIGAAPPRADLGRARPYTGVSARILPIRSSSGVAEPSANSYCFSHKK